MSLVVVCSHAFRFNLVSEEPLNAAAAGCRTTLIYLFEMFTVIDFCRDATAAVSALIHCSLLRKLMQWKESNGGGEREGAPARHWFIDRFIGIYC